MSHLQIKTNFEHSTRQATGAVMRTRSRLLGSTTARLVTRCVQFREDCPFHGDLFFNFEHVSFFINVQSLLLHAHG